MVKKWAILQKPLYVDIDNIQNVVMAITCLHNFCIRERIARKLTPPNTLPDMPDVTLLPSVVMEDDPNDEGDPIETDADEPGTYDFPGHSHVRHAMVLRVARKGYVRPP